jgi:hypothetical protein
VPGNGGSGDGGNGGDALEDGAVYGLLLSQSDNSVVAGASILVDATATGGKGGDGDAGAGGYGLDVGATGAAATGGDGGAATGTMEALAASQAQGLTVSDLSSYIYATVNGGDGGKGTGGAGGDSHSTGGSAGAGTGGKGGAVHMLAANIDLNGATDVTVTDSQLHTEVTIKGGTGGKGIGGAGGESELATGGAGGAGDGGDGGWLGAIGDPVFVATVIVDNSSNVSLISAEGDLIVSEKAGNGGDGLGGNGGDHNGVAGTADAGEGALMDTHTEVISSNVGTTGLVVDDFFVNESASSSVGVGGAATNGTPGAP